MPLRRGGAVRKPKAAEIAGTTVLEGRQVIGDYWRQALDRIGTLRFRLGHVTCDVERREVVVFYEATLGGVTGASARVDALQC